MTPTKEFNSQKSFQDDDDSQSQLVLHNIQDQFFDIINTDEVENVLDLNEKFLSIALGGVDVSELALLPKLELRVDTASHSL